MLDYEYVLERVDDACRRIRLSEEQDKYLGKPFREIPGVSSAQIKALVFVMVDLFNTMEMNSGT